MKIAMRPAAPRDRRLLSTVGTAAPARGESLRSAAPLPVDGGDLGVVAHEGGRLRGAVLGAAWLLDAGSSTPPVVLQLRDADGGPGLADLLLRTLLGTARDEGVTQVRLPNGDETPIAARAAVVDLDDTLLDHRNAAAAAVVGLATDLGLPRHGAVGRWERISAFHYERYQAHEIDLVEQRRVRVREFLGRPRLPDEEAEAHFTDYQRRYRAGWAAHADALPALRAARAAGLAVAVLTNGEQDLQTEKLRATGLLDDVDVVLASSSLPAAKPDPRAFEAAAERLGVAVTELLVVGDSMRHDVRGALAVGADAVLLDRAGRHHAAARAGVRRVETLADVRWPTPPG